MLTWYIVKLVFQIKTEGCEHRPQFDEQYRLVRADDQDWAIEKAGILGRIESSTFQNSNHQNVTWKFLKVTEVFSIGKIEDGMELLAQTKEPEDVNRYLQLINRKAAFLQKKSTDSMTKQISILTGEQLSYGHN